jgi:hypothetical protein
VQVRNHTAFPTASRSTKGLRVLEPRAVWAADLVRAVVEAQAFARPFLMRYYTRVEDIPLFEGLGRLRTRVSEILAAPAPPLPPAEAEKFDLFVNGVTPRERPRKVKSPVSKVRKMGKKKPAEEPELEISTRARTVLLDGCAKEEPPKTKKVRRPQFTKLEPTIPHEPELEIDADGQPAIQSRAESTKFLPLCHAVCCPTCGSERSARGLNCTMFSKDFPDFALTFSSTLALH